MIGIDEVGRGALAGPLVVAGCYFTQNPASIAGLNDSKKLKKALRRSLDPLIKSNTLFHIVEIPPSVIDKKGITLALRDAIYEIVERMPQDEIIQLDGTYNFLKGTQYEHRTRIEIGADGIYPAVMAASVIAKVYRDEFMERMHETYPYYGFDAHVGYGTKRHIMQLNQHGPSPIHRKSFAPVKNMLKRESI